MRNKQIICPIYVKILGKYLKEEMKKKGLKQDEVGLTCGQDDIKMISSTTIREILEAVKIDSHFENSLLRLQLLKFLNRRYGNNEVKFENFEKHIIDKFIVSLLDLFPTFPVEETSYEISEKICDWLSELACLLSQ